MGKINFFLQMFSIVVPTYNNLEYLKIFLSSIKKFKIQTWNYFSH